MQKKTELQGAVVQSKFYLPFLINSFIISSAIVVTTGLIVFFIDILLIKIDLLL